MPDGQLPVVNNPHGRVIQIKTKNYQEIKPLLTKMA